MNPSDPNDPATVDYWKDAEAKAQVLYDLSHEHLSRYWEEATIIRGQLSHVGRDPEAATDYMLDRMSALFDEMVGYGHMDEDDMNQEAWDSLWAMIDEGLD
jgi:hypothetical protein